METGKMNRDTDIVVVGAARTPMSNFGGTLKDLKCYELGALAIQGALKKGNVAVEQIDDVMGGNTRQAGNGPNPVRTAALKAGIGSHVHAVTINNACPSSMKASIFAIQNIKLGETSLAAIVGMESMSTIPYFIKDIRWKGVRFGDFKVEDGWGDAVDPFLGVGMGITAENLVVKYGLSRRELDEFAVDSHAKAAAAQDNGWFDEEIEPITLPGSKNKPGVVFSRDESIRRDTDIEKMSALKPSFKPDGVVTAANSCGLTDGASSMLITTRQKAAAIGAKPLFRIVSYASASVENAYMGEGPGVAIPKALENAKLSLKDMDVIEVNEAFAAQVVANERVLGWDRSKLNVHGGAIALGHPTGCSGIRIVITGYHALKRLGKEFGVMSICGGGGPTCAMVIRNEG
jgi:acetyl-CoA C-acetyltransferase